MADTDSYLLKCALESIEKGVLKNEIQSRCKCRFGLFDIEFGNDNNITNNNGE